MGVSLWVERLRMIKNRIKRRVEISDSMDRVDIINPEDTMNKETLAYMEKEDHEGNNK